MGFNYNISPLMWLELTKDPGRSILGFSCIFFGAIWVDSVWWSNLKLVVKSHFWRLSHHFLDHVWRFKKQSQSVVDLCKADKSRNLQHTIAVFKNMEISINGGTPKWMVWKWKSYENGWFRGTPNFGNLHIISTEKCLRYYFHTKYNTVELHV